MLPPPHKYPLDCEFRSHFGEEKILGYEPLYSSNFLSNDNIYYIVWNYRHNQMELTLEEWIDHYATFST